MIRAVCRKNANVWTSGINAIPKAITSDGGAVLMDGEAVLMDSPLSTFSSG